MKWNEKQMAAPNQGTLGWAVPFASCLCKPCFFASGKRGRAKVPLVLSRPIRPRQKFISFQMQMHKGHKGNRGALLGRCHLPLAFATLAFAHRPCFCASGKRAQGLRAKVPLLPLCPFCICIWNEMKSKWQRPRSLVLLLAMQRKGKRGPLLWRCGQKLLA